MSLISDAIADLATRALEKHAPESDFEYEKRRAGWGRVIAICVFAVVIAIVVGFASRDAHSVRLAEPVEDPSHRPAHPWALDPED